MQEIRNIPLSKLHLWTENPRDPIMLDMDDRDVIKKAICDETNTWELDKLLSNFGNVYQLNKLPTVVLVDGKYVIYDGNRRVAMLKCIQDDELFSLATGRFNVFSPAEELLSIHELPCDVCDLNTALDIVEADHKGAGKWGMLQYEWFLHFHRKQPKGTLMLIEEAFPGSISKTKLNEEYVRSRLLTKSNLNQIGFDIVDERLVSIFDQELSRDMILDLAKTRDQGITSHRKNPGDIKAALKTLDPEKYKNFQEFNSDVKTYDLTEGATSQNTRGTNTFTPPRRRKPLRKTSLPSLFHGRLYPKGERSNQLYRALEDVYRLYCKNPASNEHLLPLIAMGFRLLLDTVAREYYAEIDADLAQKDETYKQFLKSVAKPALAKQVQRLNLNRFSLAEEWIDGNYNLEAILGKWAHGSMLVTVDSVLNTSYLVGDIIRETWSEK